MKKTILLFFLITCFYSCVCNNEEVYRNLINDSDKVFLNNEIKEVKFIDQDGNEILANYEAPNFQLSKDDVGPETCEYYTTEKGSQKIKIGKYEGSITLSYEPQLMIRLDNYVAYNYLNVVNSEQALDKNIQDIEIKGITFTNVLLLENTYKEGIWDIEKIVYSKENGIEFILFKNGNWYKRK